MLFKTAISTLAFMSEFTSGTKINDAKEHSTQLKQKDDRKLKREQRRSTGLLKKRLENGLVDDAKDRGGVKLEPDVGVLRGKDRQLKKEKNVCDPYFGTDGYGLCVSFCVARDNAKARFIKATGMMRLPCEACPPSCVVDGLMNDACAGATGEIGCGSCDGKLACFNAAGNIGEYSCVGVGVYPCAFSEGNIENNSCVGKYACFDTKGNIGSGSCIGEKSCCGNTTDIGDGLCNEDYECCDPNSQFCGGCGV